MKSHGLSFLGGFHPEEGQSKPTIAVCRIMSVTYMQNAMGVWGKENMSTTLSNGASGNGVRDGGDWASRISS